MDEQTTRISIQLADGTAVQVTSGVVASGTTGALAAVSAAGGIDAGSPPPALVAILGDPELGQTVRPSAEPAGRRAAGNAIDAGSFPAALAAEMESEGPRHPLGHQGGGMLATAMMPPFVDSESRN
jgi:hypothetical protein